MGGTFLQIEGLYFYSSDSVPADVRVGGKGHYINHKMFY